MLNKNALGSGVAIRNDARYYVSIVNIEHLENIKWPYTEQMHFNLIYKHKISVENDLNQINFIRFPTGA